MATSIYSIKTATGLSDTEINAILINWGIEEWQQMHPTDFKENFSQSEFHLLQDANENLLAAARINFGFYLQIQTIIYKFPELVGLVAIEKMQGFGKILVENIRHNLSQRNIEAIGFCEAALQPFYQKCGTEILYWQAKFLREAENGQWGIATDDHIINISLSAERAKLLKSLSEETLGYVL